jgi:hypothetical protein
VVSARLTQRVARLSLVELMAEIDAIGACPHTEVELYRAWVLANDGSPLVFAAWFNLAGAFVRGGDENSAVIAYQNVLVLNPGFVAASTALGMLQGGSARMGHERPA